MIHVRTTPRTNSLISDGELEELFRLNNFPVHMGTTSNKNMEDDYCADLVFDIDKKTGFIQLRNLVPEDILYSNAHYNNVASNWKEHHEAFAEFIASYNPATILEIGGGTGILSVCYQNIRTAEWTILDAVPNPVKECKAKYIEGIFDEHYRIDKEYEAIVASHTLEHLYNPQECIANISRYMKDGTMFFISIPNLESCYRKHYTNILNFEHTYLAVEPYISYMLENNGLKVTKRQLFRDDHSVFYAVRKQSNCKKYSISGNYYHKYKSLFAQWINFHYDLVKKINYEMVTIKSSKIYLFGAHAYAQFLIAFGLKIDMVEAILDNDERKQGQRLCGTNLKVVSPKVLIGQSVPVVILYAGVHTEEIRNDIVNNINNRVIFI